VKHLIEFHTYRLFPGALRVGPVTCVRSTDGFGPAIAVLKPEQRSPKLARIYHQ
jgi:hypothetical protein